MPGVILALDVGRPRDPIRSDTSDCASIFSADYDGQDGDGKLRYRVHYRTASGHTRARFAYVAPGQ